MTEFEALSVAQRTLLVLLPELVILLVATAMMTAGAFVKLPRRTWAAISAATLLVAFFAQLFVRNVVTDPFASVALNDSFSWFGRFGFVFTGLILLGMAHDQVDDDRAAEFFGALLMMHAGAMLVAAANELVFLFVGLELVSIPTYLLLYLPRKTTTTQEAATKYFFLSVFSSGLLLFGMAYLYGISGVSNLKAISYLIHWENNSLLYPQPKLGLIAVVFIVAGLGFRVAAVPFHWYAPDVYEGSPTFMAALLAWIPKGVGFLALLRMLASLFGYEHTIANESLQSNLAILSERGALLAGMIGVATMTLGNTVALRQENLRRLFAYSSIAHAGYLMVGLAAAFRNGPTGGSETYLGSEGIFLYLATYALMTLGAFAVIMALSSKQRSVETIDDFSGLVWTNPLAALAMGLCLFSLAGVPPMAGFYGKLWVFGSALSVAKGSDTRMFQTLAILGVLNAAVGAYYYLRILIKMTLSPPPERPLTPKMAWPTVLAFATCAGLSLLLGIATAPLASAARSAGVAAISLPQDEPLPKADVKATMLSD